MSFGRYHNHPRNVQQLRLAMRMLHDRRLEQGYFKTHLTIYGTMETAKQANAAQLRYTPDPTETMMPIGTGLAGDPMRISLSDSDFLMSTVQMLAPMRMKRLPTMAKAVETKNVRLFLRIPLKANTGTD